MMKLTAYKVPAKPGTVSLAMPRRARVIAVSGGVADHVLVHTQCLHDDDTRAFDVNSARQFAVLRDGDTIPDGAQYVGTGRPGPKAEVVHLYEMPKVRPTGL